ncbi:MAG: transglutaminase-like cysteine peptidase [Nitratireductor sp.]
MTIIKNAAKALIIYGALVASSQIANAGTPQMQTGKFTSQPIGHYEFCKIYGQECNVRSNKTAPTKLTRDAWSQMIEANAYANTQIKAVTDSQFYGVVEKWEFPKTAGDCEDFVLLKRHILISNGWPPSSLLITVVRQSNGEGHAVLTVRTDRGDYILDNLENRVELWSDTNYTYLKRQAPSHSGRWEDIKDTRNLSANLN